MRSFGLILVIPVLCIFGCIPRVSPQGHPMPSITIPLSKSETIEIAGEKYSIIGSDLYLDDKVKSYEMQCEVPFYPDDSHRDYAFNVARHAYKCNLPQKAEALGIKFGEIPIVLDKQVCIALCYHSNGIVIERVKRYYFSYNELCREVDNK